MPTPAAAGVIPLRPLRLADIYDGAVKVIRLHPRAMIGFAFWVLLVAAVIEFALNYWLGYASPALEPTSPDDLPSPTTLVSPGSVASLLASTVLSGLVVVVVGEAVLGRRPDVHDLWVRARGRLGTLVTYSVIVFALGAGLLVGWVGGLLGAVDNEDQFLGLAFIGVVVLIGVILPLNVGFSFTPAALMLERVGIATAVRRSFTLIRRRFWPVLGITMLTTILTSIISMLLAAAVTEILDLLVRDAADLPEPAWLAADSLSTFVSGLITTPFSAAVNALLYIDARIRKENLDIVLLREISREPIR